MTPMDDIASIHEEEGHNKGTVFLVLALAFAIRITSSFDKDLSRIDAKRLSVTIFEQNLMAWILIVLTMAVASDIEVSRDLALAFSFLILIAVIMQDGLQLLSKISGWIDQQSNKSGLSEEQHNIVTLFGGEEG